MFFLFFYNVVFVEIECLVVDWFEVIDYVSVCLELREGYFI